MMMSDDELQGGVNDWSIEDVKSALLPFEGDMSLLVALLMALI